MYYSALTKCSSSYINRKNPNRVISYHPRLWRYQSLLASSANALWGVRYVKHATYLSSFAQLINCSNSILLLHQFTAFFILCLDIIGNPEHANLEEDLVSISWISDYAEMVIKERVELKPVMVIIKALATACQQTKMIRLPRAA